MAQFARPVSLISNDDWTASSGTDFYDLIDEVSASDSDYIAHPGGSLGEILFGLTAVSDPGVHTGHTFRVRAQYTSLSTGLDIELLDGSTVIKSATPTLTASFADYATTLSAGEAASITDYSNLRFKFSGTGNPLQVSWAEFEVPNAASGSGGFTLEPDLIDATSLLWDSPNPKGNGKDSEVLFLKNTYNGEIDRMWRQEFKPRTTEGARNKKVCTMCGMYCSGDFITYFRNKPYCPDHCPRETNRGPNAVRI